VAWFLLQILSNPKLIPCKNTLTLTDCLEETNYLSLGLGSNLNSGILRWLPKKNCAPKPLCPLMFRFLANIVLWASKLDKLYILKVPQKHLSWNSTWNKNKTHRKTNSENNCSAQVRSQFMKKLVRKEIAPLQSTKHLGRRDTYAKCTEETNNPSSLHKQSEMLWSRLCDRW
jgi:hypothetical protein